MTPDRQTILCVVGTRPNFMKMAPVMAELRRRSDRFVPVLAHTGQHYDDEMSAIFFEELGVEAPDFTLGVGSGTHAQQTARVMERLEPVIEEIKPDLLLVPGDVNSTLGAALVASKLMIPVGHVEAGLRSFDRSMPEEINRVVTDQLSELLFTQSPEATDHLLAEGIAPHRIHYVGNTMIDTLVSMRQRIESQNTPAALDLTRGEYLLVTLHRPALVDSRLLSEALIRLRQLSSILTVVFPAHPRTAKRMLDLGFDPHTMGMRMLAPLGYLDFLSLLDGSAGALTDSGGIQEETTFLGIPCFTLRENTERPVTVHTGTNTLLGLSPERIADIPVLLAAARMQRTSVPPLWDGQAAPRIADVLAARSDSLGSTES